MDWLFSINFSKEKNCYTLRLGNGYYHTSSKEELKQKALEVIDKMINLLEGGEENVQRESCN